MERWLLERQWRNADRQQRARQLRARQSGQRGEPQKRQRMTA
jgi:hypothetical protein